MFASMHLGHMLTECSKQAACLIQLISAWGTESGPSTPEAAAVQDIDAIEELEPDPRKGRRRTRAEKGSWADGAFQAQVLPHQACESRCDELPRFLLQQSE